MMQNHNKENVLKMKSGVYKGYRSFEIIEQKVPKITSGYALVKVSHCGISMMELDAYLGKNPSIIPPRILGHEFCGVVSDIYNLKNNKNLLNKKVVVDPIIHCGHCKNCIDGITNHCDNLEIIGFDKDGGFSEFVKVPVQNLYSLTEQQEFEIYTIACSLAIAIHGVSKLNLRKSKNIAILGAGSVGLLCGLMLLGKNDIKINIIDSNNSRLNIARNLGLSCIVNREADLNNNMLKHYSHMDKPEVVIVTSNKIDFLELAIKLVKPNGQLIVIGNMIDKIPCNILNIIEKEIYLTGSYLYTKKDFQKSIKYLSSYKYAYSNLITHRLPIDGILEGIRIIENGDSSMKIIICN